MAYIATHEDKRIRCRSNDCGYMTDSVPGNIQNIETAVPEIIVGLVATYLEIIAERWFDNLSALEVFFIESRVLVCWVAWEKSFLEPRANDQISLWIEPCKIPAVV